jgi:hypothetical protein
MNGIINVAGEVSTEAELKAGENLGEVERVDELQQCLFDDFR